MTPGVRLDNGAGIGRSVDSTATSAEHSIPYPMWAVSKWPDQTSQTLNKTRKAINTRTATNFIEIRVAYASVNLANLARRVLRPLSVKCTVSFMSSVSGSTARMVPTPKVGWRTRVPGLTLITDWSSSS